MERSQQEGVAKEAALRAEQARAAGLVEQVAQEAKGKVKIELRAYRDLAARAEAALQTAIVEIDAGREVTALVYVSQGKALADDARSKVTSMRAVGGTVYESRAAELATAAGDMVGAAKHLRTAILYIGEQGSSDFTTAFSAGKAALASGSRGLASVSAFIAGE